MNEPPRRFLDAMQTKRYLVFLVEIVLLLLSSIVSYQATRNSNELINEVIFFLIGFFLGGWVLLVKYSLEKSGGDYKYLPFSQKTFVDFFSPLLLGNNATVSALIILLPVVLTLLNVIVLVTLSRLITWAYMAPGFYLLTSIAIGGRKS